MRFRFWLNIAEAIMYGLAVIGVVVSIVLNHV